MLYSRVKLEEELESDDESSSVLVVRLPLPLPPMRTRPAGDCQLEWSHLSSRRLWLTTQPPAESLIQVSPPQLMKPSWVWLDLPMGRGGRVQGRGVPAPDNTSTEV